MSEFIQHPGLPQGFSTTFPARFFEKIQITESCWFWTGCRMPNGYGRIGCRGFIILAHRASWILHFGPIPQGCEVLHDCPNGDCPWCVNPAHLWLGRQLENVHDMISKGRLNRTGRAHGMEHTKASLTDNDVHFIRENYPLRTQCELARMFDITQGTVWAVVHRVSWKHLS